MAQYLNPYAGLADGLMGAANVYASKKAKEEEEAKRKAALEEERGYEEKLWKRAKPERDAKAVLAQQKLMVEQLRQADLERKGMRQDAMDMRPTMTSAGGGRIIENAPLMGPDGSYNGGGTPTIHEAPPREARPQLGELVKDGVKYVYDKRDPEGTMRRVGEVDTKAGPKQDNADTIRKKWAGEAKAIGEAKGDTLRSIAATRGMDQRDLPTGDKPLRDALLAVVDADYGARLAGASKPLMAQGMPDPTELDVSQESVAEGAMLAPVYRGEQPAQPVADRLAADTNTDVNIKGRASDGKPLDVKSGKPGSSKDKPTLDEYLEAVTEYAGRALTAVEKNRAVAQYNAQFNQE